MVEQLNDFIASRDLSPEDFEKFGEQLRRAYLHNRTMLNERRATISALEYANRVALKSINRVKADMMRHGIDVPS